MLNGATNASVTRWIGQPWQLEQSLYGGARVLTAIEWSDNTNMEEYGRSEEEKETFVGSVPVCQVFASR